METSVKEAQSSTPRLFSFHKWLAQLGVTSTTGWRWRKKGIVKTTNIYGRLYVTEDAIKEFLARAQAGEFAIEVKPRQSGLANRSL